MSRSINGKPGFRLRFACSAITLDRSDRPGQLRVLNPDAPELLTELREVAAEIAACRGRLVVELPASEVWRGLVPDLGRLGREKAARGQMAARLGMSRSALSLRVGRRDASGATPVAAVAAATVAETRRFLAQAGLRAERIVGAGTFPGFDTAPDFTASDRTALRRLGPAAAGAAVAAALALVMLHPAMKRDLVVSSTPQAVEAEPSIAAATTLAVEPQARPLPRPADLPRVALLPDIPPTAPGPVPQAPRAPGLAREPALLPLVTVATRNFPVSTLSPRPQADGTIRLAELTVARARLDDTRIDAPMQRPASGTATTPVEAAVRVALADPVAPAFSPSRRPMARPGSAATAPAAAAAPAAAPAEAVAAPQLATETGLSRPQPRPAAASSAALSQAITEAVVTASVAGPTTTFATQTASTGLAAASLVAAGRPEPRRFTANAAPAPAKTVVTAKPKPAAAPQKVARLAPAPAQPVRVQPKQVRVQPAPVKVQPKAVASTSGAAATQKVGFSRNSVSLIGVFGGGTDRHALVRLPNGKMQRVRPGDRLQGAKVAAIGKDTVQLTGGGRNAVLTMPN